MKKDFGVHAQISSYKSDWEINDTKIARNTLDTVGFTCIEEVLSSKLLSKLRSEAFDKKKDATPVSSTSECQYQARLASLGGYGSAFLAGQGITQLLDTTFDLSLTLEKDASCYTYYQPGDFLDPHLDHSEVCKVTVILYLDVVHTRKQTDKTGLELHVFGDSLSDADKPKVVFPTRTGSLIIGLGSINWHKRPTLQEDEYVTAITACYS